MSSSSNHYRNWYAKWVHLFKFYSFFFCNRLRQSFASKWATDTLNDCRMASFVIRIRYIFCLVYQQSFNLTRTFIWSMMIKIVRNSILRFFDFVKLFYSSFHLISFSLGFFAIIKCLPFHCETTCWSWNSKDYIIIVFVEKRRNLYVYFLKQFCDSVRWR